MHQIQTERSDFEIGWANCPKGQALTQKRSWEFDPTAALLFAPSRFHYQRVKTPQNLPADEWTRKSFLQFVRGEFRENTNTNPEAPKMPKIHRRTFVDHDLTLKYLAASEKLVYGGYFDELMSRTDDNLASKMHAILSDAQLGNRRNSKNISKSLLEQWTAKLMKDNHRIRFVIPAFPFKDQNPFRTNSRPSSPDLAEVALLIHMYLNTQALYQVHPFGVDWVLLCDGVSYAKIFGVQLSEAISYREQLCYWRNYLNISNTISVVDLSELSERADGCSSAIGNRPFSLTRNHLRLQLESAVEYDSEDVKKAFNVLKRGMAWNLNSRSYLKRICHEELWRTLKSVGRDSYPNNKIAVEIDARASEAALEYASFNLALRYFDAVNLFIPGSLRATIHPKPDQIAAPSLSRDTASFPWNGVPMVLGDSFEPGRIIVDSLHVHGGHFDNLEAIVDANTSDPFYFRPVR